MDGQGEPTPKPVYVINPLYAGLFFVVGLAFLLVIGVSVRFVLGYSAASDRVFAIEALVSGVLANLVIRYAMHRRLMLIPKLPIPFIYFWPLLCLYIYIARPFE